MLTPDNCSSACTGSRCCRRAAAPIAACPLEQSPFRCAWSLLGAAALCCSTIGSPQVSCACQHTPSQRMS